MPDAGSFDRMCLGMMGGGGVEDSREGVAAGRRQQRGHLCSGVELLEECHR